MGNRSGTTGGMQINGKRAGGIYAWDRNPWVWVYTFELISKEESEREAADKATIKQNVARLIRMTTQKTAGQRSAKGDIDWNCLDHTLLAIACAATSLALSGYFGEMPNEIEGDPP